MVPTVTEEHEEQQHRSWPDGPVTPRTPREIDAGTARGWMIMCLVGGFVLAVFGTALAAAEYPTTTSLGFYRGLDLGTHTDGSWTGFWVGVFLAGVGEMAVFVGLVALGVMLGNRASRT